METMPHKYKTDTEGDRKMAGWQVALSSENHGHRVIRPKNFIMINLICYFYSSINLTCGVWEGSARGAQKHHVGRK